ncbi:MAG: hypothetical protein Q7T50_06440, partial [Candidatus Magasanikbacteria bacterium]|nr:hypothetical protein [Candidatus Magasanikbacteria bacterium]
MKFDPRLHHRQSTRLGEYDYSQFGVYFITICVQDKKSFFGEIIDDEMVLNETGRMIECEMKNLSDRFKNIELDEYVVMPNHVHGIFAIVEDESFVEFNSVGVPLVGT